LSSTFFTFVFNDLRVLSEHSPGKFDLRVPGRHDLSGLRLFRHLRLHVTFDAELVERIKSRELSCGTYCNGDSFSPSLWSSIAEPWRPCSPHIGRARLLRRYVSNRPCEDYRGGRGKCQVLIRIYIILTSIFVFFSTSFARRCTVPAFLRVWIVAIRSMVFPRMSTSFARPHCRNSLSRMILIMPLSSKKYTRLFSLPKTRFKAPGESAAKVISSTLGGCTHLCIPSPRG